MSNEAAKTRQLSGFQNYWMPAALLKSAARDGEKYGFQHAGKQSSGRWGDHRIWSH